MQINRHRARILLVSVIAVAAIGSQSAATAAIATSRSAPPAWHTVRGAKLAPNNVLNGVAAVSKQLAWAVGMAGFSSDGKAPGRPVIERWNARSWSNVRLPSTWPGGLGFVAASSARDAWALGQDSSGTRDHLLHWTGTRWHEVAFPGPSGTLTGNLGLTAAATHTAWLIATAVRSAQIFGWNGSRWRSESYPCRAFACNLYAISARTASDAWAVGNYDTGTGTGASLALHWTGRRWHPTAVPAIKFGYLTGVFAVSRTDAWAVGNVFNTGRMLLFHWNGTAWHQVRTPSGLTAPMLGELTGITGDSAGHLWIYDFGPQTGLEASYLHYDGHRWSLLQGPVINDQIGVTVRDVAVIPGTTTAWSVGLGFTPPVEARARIERYS